MKNKNGFIEGRKPHSSRSRLDIIEKSDKLKDLFITSSNNHDYKFNILIHLIGSKEVLALAYERIKSKPGNISRGSGVETLDGISVDFRDKISKELLAGKFKFSPARRTYIPTPGKSEKRPLRITSPREKVVQKAVQRVLEIIYEPRFKDTSHGFRPGKGTHTALKDVYLKMKAPVWFREADISECFDSISHKELRKVREKKITCRKTLTLIKSARVAGYVELGGIAQRAIEGTPQGSVLSPLLCNIYMHELDQFIEELKKRFDVGLKRAINPEYNNLVGKIQRRKKNMGDLHSLKVLQIQKRKMPSKDLMDPFYKKMQYIRYADNFFISIIGSYKDAMEMRKEIEEFLKQKRKLNLNRDKTLIKKSTDTAFFLETEISKKSGTAKVVRTVSNKYVRISGYRSRNAPIEKILDKLNTKRGMRRGIGSTINALPRRRLTNREHGDILTYFNAVTRGLRDYYTFAANRSARSKVVWMIWKSCAATLAKKYKLPTIKKAVEKFGKNLEDKESGKSFYIPDTLNRINKFATNEVDLSMLHKKWVNKITKSNLNKVCCICGSSPAEMHHLRKIRDLKNRRDLSWFSVQMASINRKQVPLCSEHHKKVHNNTLNQEERNLFELNKKKVK